MAECETKYKRRSSVWLFFDKTHDGGKCRICSGDVKGSHNTTNLTNHLKRKHSVEWKAYLEDKAPNSPCGELSIDTHHHDENGERQENSSVSRVAMKPKIKREENDFSYESFFAAMEKYKTINSKTENKDYIATSSSSQDISLISIKDESSVFGEYIAFELRSIKDQRHALLLKKKIQDVIFETKMSILTYDDDHSIHVIPNDVNMQSSIHS